MKIGLLSVAVCVALANTVVFSVVGGCGVFRALPLAVGWHLVTLIQGSSFADRHAHIVAALSALLSACFWAALVALVALTARKMGLLTSERSLGKFLAVASIVYVLLGLLPLPVGPCF